MKKIYILTAVFALLTLSLNAQDLKVDQFGNVVQPKAQTGKVKAPSRAATQVTVCDGTNTNAYVPFYGLYFDDNYQIDQMIYPETLLTDLVGKTITSVTFYARSNFSSNIGSGKFTFKIGTTNQTTFSSPITRITTGMTAVATNMTMSNCISGSQLIIDFSDNPFTYQGGNLVLDYELTTLASGWSSTYFYGQDNHTSASFYGYGSSTNSYGVYSNSTITDFLPKVTFGAEDASPKIEVSPTTLTINDSGTNNTFTVQGSNLGSDDVGVTVPQGSAFSTTTSDQWWGFENTTGSVDGTVTVTYGGRDLRATETVTVANNVASATVGVTYVPDLYIYCDNGASPWDFSANPAIAMTYQGNGIYTATLGSIPDGSHILFGRTSGLTYYWEGDGNRLFIGASTGGEDWSYGQYTWGYLDTDPYNDSPVKYHPISFSEGGTYTVTINANDYTFTIEKLVLPPPENVEATPGNNLNATVTWDAPSDLPTTINNEDFEDTNVFPPFTTGGIDATQHTGAFGEWTLYDATGGCIVYGSKQLDYEHEGEPHAWFVFAPSGATASSDYPNAVAHDSYSGAQYLESICPQSNTTAAGVSDHWLISPELSGNAQTISFFASEMTTQYGDETYEIWVSTTDNNPSSFTILGGTHNVSLDTWEEQLVELPAGTKYFAIRHTSEDIFGLLIDDVHYEGVIKPVSYNVYLNGELVGSVDADDPLTYDFNNLTVGEHTVEISAVYPGNIESEKVADTFTILEKTATPTITMVDNGNGTYTITATATSPDTDAEVTLNVTGQQPVTGTGSASVTITQTNSGQSVTATATALATGKVVSDEASEDFTIPAMPITPTPVITYEITPTSVIITATGEGEVTLNVTGQQPATGQGSASVTVPRTTEDQSVTATATAVAPYHQPSAQAEETITIPEAGRSPMPTINMVDNGDGTYTITITGTGDLAVYINDAEHGGTSGDPVATGNQTVSFNVEQHSQTMTITVQATNQEEGLAVSRTAEETYTIPAMSLDGFTPLNPQPANTSTPIDLSNLMFVDRFSKEIPATNDHPALYDYYLQETQVRQRTSNSVEVPVKHTGSDGLGYYTLSQLDNDVNVGEYDEENDVMTHDLGLKMGVRNAAMDLPLEADPSIYFYTESRGTKAYPDQADRKWLAVLQHTTDGTYSETLNPSYDWGEVYPGGQHHIHYDMDTITGEYNDYLTYVPIVWTMGFDRVNYETDHTHNSYGAPKWKTGVAKVEVQSVNAERQTGVQGSTNWTEGNVPCSMYMIDEITAIGTMPTVNTMPYEPYMFRVFVESKNGKLRGYRKIGDGATVNDGTHYEGDGNGPVRGPICVWSEYVKGSDYIGENGNEYTFSRGKISEVDTLGHWTVPDYKNIMFAAEDTLKTEVNQLGQTVIKKDELNIFVRFYYIVEGSAEGHTIPASGPYTAQRNRDGGDAPGGYGSESPGASPSPSTAVHEITFEPGDIVSQKYYNVQGMQSDKPFEGINIVVTRYSSGLTTTKKVVL